MKNLIAQLKRSIHEAKAEREKVIKDICQGKKILSNLQSVKEVVIYDKEAMQRDFEHAMDKSTHTQDDTSFGTPFSNHLGKRASMLACSGTKSSRK